MSFWLFDPKSFKDSALFPTGGIGNFLNTLTLLVLGLAATLKTKFPQMMTDKNILIYSSIALVIITLSGYFLCRNEQSSSIDNNINFDLTYE